MQSARRVLTRLAAGFVLLAACVETSGPEGDLPGDTPGRVPTPSFEAGFDAELEADVAVDAVQETEPPFDAADALAE